MNAKAVAFVLYDRAVERAASLEARRLARAGTVVRRVAAPTGEAAKRLVVAERILEKVAAADQGAGIRIVAVGGGALLDLAGFVAGVYKRGVPVEYVPTTLLAMVDASVGGKTGVNLRAGKNLVGVFREPDAIRLDPSHLDTLPARAFRQGLAEVAKHALLEGGSHLRFAEGGATALAARAPRYVAEAVARSVRYKRRIVEKDFRETRGIREFLNLGHTTAHALERVASYSLPHGEAVAMGLVVAAEVSARLYPSARALPVRVRSLLTRLGLPTRVPSRLGAAPVLSATRLDKKSRTGRLRMTLLRGTGRPVVRDGVPLATLRAALAAARG